MQTKIPDFSNFSPDFLLKQAYTSKRSLDLHLESHKGEDRKKFQCHVCSKILTTKSSLTSHLHVHNNLRSFKCVTCGKGFNNKTVSIPPHPTAVRDLVMKRCICLPFRK